MAKINLEELARKAMSEAVSELDTHSVTDIAASKITPNEKNFYEKSDLESLAASIELTGLLHPIIVKPADGGYVIIDGERRFRAMTDVLGMEAVPAIIRRPVNDVLEELMLIEANRQQRKMSASDLSKQAERYTELLSQLRDSGVEIPGRLRDAVAEAMQLSASKLARLHAIRTNLISSILADFDDNQLPESVAYAYSQLPAEEQNMIYASITDANINATGYTVRDLAEKAQKFCSAECPLSDAGTCSHVLPRVRHCAKVNSWARCNYRCCRDCFDRFSCKSACPQLAEEIAAEKAETAARQREADAARKQEEKERHQLIEAELARLREMRDAAGLDPEDTGYRSAIGWQVWSLLRSAAGTYAPMPEDALTLRGAVAMADLFGVSLDEIAGRGDGVQSGHGGVEWNVTALTGVPEPDYERTLLVCDGAGHIRTVAADQIAQIFELMEDWCVWWAYIDGPDDEDPDDEDF